MEPVIFLHADEESEEMLSQLRQSPAQRLVLVASAQIDPLHLSLLLRLARRYIIAQGKQLCLVSEDRLAQMLATRMGFATASTLDEYRGLKPGPRSSSKRARRSSTQISLAALRPPLEPPTPPDWLEASPPGSSAQRSAGSRGKPNANLAKLLEEGYLPNPAAAPDLEEEKERAEREEPEWLSYEIADEDYPSQAEQEAEQHEAQIVARIRKTSQRGSTDAPELPSATLDRPTDGAKGEPAAGPTESAETPPEDWPPTPPAGQSARELQAPAAEAPRIDAQPENRGSHLPPLRTIDDLILERGSAALFQWFEGAATAAAAALAGNARLISAASAPEMLSSAGSRAAAVAPAAPPTTAAAPGETLRQFERNQQRLKPAFSGKRWQLRPPGSAEWRRIGMITALGLSLLMLGMGFALIPSAEVSYQQEMTPYSEVLLLDASPGVSPQQAAMHTATPQPVLAPAAVARFDGVLTALAPATGRRAAPDNPNHLVAFPTQADVDQLASSLQAQLQTWGERALRAQAGQGDILGPLIARTETRAFPPVGASLPPGVSRFQVSLALHLRAALIRRQTLLQALENRLRQDVSRREPGFAPQPAQAPALTILSVDPAGPGDEQLELLVRAQARVVIGPTLTPGQVRSAIAGLSVADAAAYLSRQPGISHLSIDVQPKWLNRLPIFPARITINLESSGGSDAAARA